MNNGQFTFGSHGGVTPTVGWILSSNIGEDGALEAKNGEFADWTIANNGNVHVHSNAILHINSLTGNGSTVNEGKLSLDEKHGNLPVFDVTGNFLNKGQNSVLDASKVDKVTVSGTHANEGKAELQRYADCPRAAALITAARKKATSSPLKGLMPTPALRFGTVSPLPIPATVKTPAIWMSEAYLM